MTGALVVTESRAVLAQHAKSFRWAARFLPAAARDDAAVVYAFCRLIDDTADDAVDTETAGVLLDLLRNELLGRSTPRPLVETFLRVAERTGMDIRYALELIEGVQSDLGQVCFETDRDLLRYGYRVAGTVGLMMCAVLGVDDRVAIPHAIDLGVAMQITNICRDVKEDAAMGRVYLPAERLRAAGVDPQDLLDGNVDRHALSRVVRDLLDLAEAYYQSADYGMRYIPARSRLAILVAARLYRGIGRKLLRNGADPLVGRTWVGLPGKLYLIARALGRFASPRIIGMSESPGHDQQLHLPLRGLPGVQ